MSYNTEIPDPLSIPLPEDLPPLPPPSPPPPPPPPDPSNVASSSKDSRKRDELEADIQKEEREMMAKLGFANFNSTKGKKVPGNQVGAVHVVKKRRYRQYMNRKGGFNRPLDKVA